MQTVDKAMHVLSFFSISQPELGLTELARLTGFDKAATRRFLMALAKHGFTEQNQENRKYRLGSGFLRLARIRESMVPASKVTEPIVQWLTKKTGETAHASIMGDASLTTVAVSEPSRGAIVHIDPGEPIPFHATASGIIYLSFIEPRICNQILAKSFPSYTKTTAINREDLLRQINQARKNGYFVSANTMEEGVTGVAVPFFGSDLAIAGAISIAVSGRRIEPGRKRDLVNLLFQASARATVDLGGIMPSYLESIVNARNIYDV
jgi:DNA-binding IclR family transcriptional regulator